MGPYWCISVHDPCTTRCTLWKRWIHFGLIFEPYTVRQLRVLPVAIPNAGLTPQKNCEQAIGQIVNEGGLSCSALDTAGTPQQMHRPDRFRSRPPNIFRPSMPPEGLVQRHLVDRELFKVQAFSSVDMLGSSVRLPRTRVLPAYWSVWFSGQVKQADEHEIL